MERDRSLGEELKQYVTEALFCLMETKDYGSITITELAAKAGVCRSTFYRYFDTKDDVISAYFARAAAEFTESMGDGFIPHGDDGYYRLIHKACEAAKANKDRMLALITAHKSFLWLDFLNTVFTQVFDGQSYPDDPVLPYAYAGMLYNVLTHWTMEDCAVPVDDVSNSLFAAMFGHEYKPS